MSELRAKQSDIEGLYKIYKRKINPTINGEISYTDFLKNSGLKVDDYSIKLCKYYVSYIIAHCNTTFKEKKHSATDGTSRSDDSSRLKMNDNDFTTTPATISSQVSVFHRMNPRVLTNAFDVQTHLRSYLGDEFWRPMMASPLPDDSPLQEPPQRRSRVKSLSHLLFHNAVIPVTEPTEKKSVTPKPYINRTHVV